MIPLEIIDFLETAEIHGDGSLYINSLRWDGEELIFEIYINTLSPDIANRSWAVSTRNLRKSKIDLGWTDLIKLEDSHCLLSEFNQIQSSLYFEGHATAPERILAELYRIHSDKFGSWIEFGSYFNGGIDLVKLLSLRNGLLAQGPKDILRVYADILNANGMNTNFVLDRPPVRWNGSGYEPESEDLKVLIVGHSFFVADYFEFTEVLA